MFFTLADWKVEYKTTVSGNITLVEVYKNGQPVSQTNSVEPSELEPAAQEFSNYMDENRCGGEIALISGMPTWATGHAISAVKNRFSVKALYMPALKGCVVIDSTNTNYKLGAIIPLP